MNYLDIIILLFVGFNFVGGLAKGFIRQLVALGGILLGLFVAFYYHVTVAENLDRIIKIRDFISERFNIATELLPTLPDSVLSVVTLIVIFMVTALIASLVGHLLLGVVKLAKMSPIDKIGGGAVGLAKGVFIAMIVVQLLGLFPAGSVFMDALDQSIFAPMLNKYAPSVFQEIQEIIINRGI